FSASLLIGYLAVIPSIAFGQTLVTRSSAFNVTTNPSKLNHASPKAAPIVPTNQELRAFELVNTERIKKGLRPLVWDAELTRMARLYSEKMARQNFFSHTSPDGEGLRERSRAMGIVGFKRLGENLGYNKGFADAVSCAVVGWMRSEGHRDHILDREFTRSGLGVARSAEGRVYFTQVFAVR
ncbi:MAG TPA: CAP domain-containing protein, partial [Pyrinomonadaceae bacterium]|nr:CAP domain-containing protein [Pyrinomonadaceae bacterium]